MTDAQSSFLPIPAGSHFSLANLPYGVFRRGGQTPRVGVAIGEFVLDLAVLEEAELLDPRGYGGTRLFHHAALNPFMACGRAAWQEARRQIQHVLEADNPALRDNEALRKRALVPQDQVEMLLPVEIGDYTDFYSSQYHATNVGAIIRGPDSALNPNWLHLPVAYHGRASSVVVSGTDVRRPWGQLKPADEDAVLFAPSRAVDFELEVGFLIGPGNALGEPVAVDAALDHVFGVVLVNDWSARDVQKWEYVPLGPFLSKSFCTSISPWVVTLEALAPFQAPGPPQQATLPYLTLSDGGNPTWDMQLEVFLQTDAGERQRVCASNLRDMYWNIQQQIAHHTCGGCNLRTGDLLATGTVSGPTPDSLGCLFELTAGGKQPLSLPGGDERRFLADGDRVTITGRCGGEGGRVGFGEVAGKLLPARTDFEEARQAVEQD